MVKTWIKNNFIPSTIILGFLLMYTHMFYKLSAISEDIDDISIQIEDLRNELMHSGMIREKQPIYGQAR